MERALGSRSLCCGLGRTYESVANRSISTSRRDGDMETSSFVMMCPRPLGLSFLVDPRGCPDVVRSPSRPGRSARTGSANIEQARRDRFRPEVYPYLESSIGLAPLNQLEDRRNKDLSMPSITDLLFFTSLARRIQLDLGILFWRIIRDPAPEP